VITATRPASHVPPAPTPLDALLPPAMAQRAEEIGVAKASMDATRLLALAILAGAFIALGGIFSTVALAGAANAPWGMTRVVAGLVFSVGLVLVVVGGAELFTGNNLIVMAWASRRIGAGAVLRNWALVYLGNFLGAAGVAAAAVAARLHESGDGALGAAAMAIAAAKLRPGFTQAVVLGILCNVLVCLAVWLSYSARTTTDRVLAVVPPIAAFVAAGGLEAPAQALTWLGFLTRNLVPVTLGNMLGGSVLVAGVYWFVYLRGRA
jgi:formate transporter